MTLTFNSPQCNNITQVCEEACECYNKRGGYKYAACMDGISIKNAFLKKYEHTEAR